MSRPPASCPASRAGLAALLPRSGVGRAALSASALSLARCRARWAVASGIAAALSFWYACRMTKPLAHRIADAIDADVFAVILAMLVGVSFGACGMYALDSTAYISTRDKRP